MRKSDQLSIGLDGHVLSAAWYLLLNTLLAIILVDLLAFDDFGALHHLGDQDLDYIAFRQFFAILKLDESLRVVLET